LTFHSPADPEVPEMPKLALALAVLVAAVLPGGSLAAPTKATLPQKGVLVPGKSLAGIRLGDPQPRVIQLWGEDYRVCDWCDQQTWLYTYRDPDGIGAAVSFRNNRVVAVFTLGTPFGWKTTDGLRLGEALTRADGLYESLTWKPCIGYIAMTLKRTASVVTSIYTDGNTIYGFALTHPAQPVCQ
jgi:hypothetical protein